MSYKIKRISTGKFKGPTSTRWIFEGWVTSDKAMTYKSIDSCKAALNGIIDDVEFVTV
jgi:hypothetical protein